MRTLSNAVKTLLKTQQSGANIWELYGLRPEDGMWIRFAGQPVWVPVTEEQCLEELRADPSDTAKEYLAAYLRGDDRQCHRAAQRHSRQGWRTDPEKAKARSNRAGHTRRARKRGALGSHTDAEWQAVLLRHGGRCAECGSHSNIEKDHIIPLSDGGNNYVLNLQPLCRRCNSAKSGRLKRGAQYSIFDHPRHARP